MFAWEYFPRTDCCRSQGRSLKLFVTGSGVHNVSSCQSLCLAERGCAFVAHSELYRRCFLCAACNVKRRPSLRGGNYSAWRRLGRVPPDPLRSAQSLGSFVPEALQRRIQLHLLRRLSGRTIFFIGDSQLRYLFLYLVPACGILQRDTGDMPGKLLESYWRAHPAHPAHYTPRKQHVHTNMPTSTTATH